MKKQISLMFILFLLTAGVAQALPTYHELRRAYVKSDSLLLDRHGELLQELRVNPESRRLDWTPLKNISPALREAVIQAEDRRFYDHPGVDFKSIGAAIIRRNELRKPAGSEHHYHAAGRDTGRRNSAEKGKALGMAEMPAGYGGPGNGKKLVEG